MIAREICQRVLERAAATGADYAELFAEHTTNHAINMVDSKVDSIDDNLVAGASVRVFKGLRSVTATTVDTTEAGLLRCADEAAQALGRGPRSCPSASTSGSSGTSTRWPSSLPPWATPERWRS